MPVRHATAEWSGDLPSGRGSMEFGGGAFSGQFSFASRFEEGKGTNPEELIGAAHAGCFSMAFSNVLAESGHTPESVETTAEVHLEQSMDGPQISRIKLTANAEVPGISDEDFQEAAEGAKKNCPVSKALAGVQIDLEANLVS